MGSLPKCRATLATSEYAAFKVLSHPVPKKENHADHNLPHVQGVFADVPMHPGRAANFSHLHWHWLRYSEHAHISKLGVVVSSRGWSVHPSQQP